MKAKVYGEGRFSAKNLEKMFALSMSKTSLLTLEEKGVIPQATRVMRGTSAYRTWNIKDLPEIGSKIGYLARPGSPKVISVFSLKGGTGKSSIAFQVARTFALHGIRTLVIGLDAQESISQAIDMRTPGGRSGNADVGIYHALRGTCRVEQCIHKTDILSLFYIPETIELSILDRFFKSSLRKEYLIKEKIVDPVLATGDFDVILFDCNPAWTDTVTGALACTDIVISPFGCDVNSYKAASIFVDLMSEFQDEMRHIFLRFFIVPTFLENNRISQNILARYRLQYEDYCVTSSIRKAVSVQEANLRGLSLMETCSSSPVYSEVASMLKEINSCMNDMAEQREVGEKRYRTNNNSLNGRRGDL